MQKVLFMPQIAIAAFNAQCSLGWPTALEVRFQFAEFSNSAVTAYRFLAKTF